MITSQRVVREIPAMPREMVYGKENKPIEVAYCRVSTELVSQEDSYERQISYYTDKIKNNPNVEFGGVYADDGITGTHADIRPEFQRMIKDAQAGKINIIRCKAIQRFGRNTVDILQSVRMLREIGVGVIFEQQGINSLETTGEVLMTIMAAIAEQESRNISNNVKFGYREKFRKGEVMVNWARWLGYVRNEETKELEIVEEEATIIRRIYREFLAGYSTRNIATGLMKDGIKTAEWKKPSSDKMKQKLKDKEEHWLSLTKEERKKEPLSKWYPTTIMNILTNEKYCGDSICGKTYKVDVLSKKRMVNNGESSKFHNQNTHPAIVSRETFQMVQEEIARRNGLRGSTNSGRAKHSSKYPLSKLIECGVDGESYRRYAYYEKDGTKVPVWICRLKKVKKDDPRKCKQAWVKESDIFKLYMEIIQEIGADENFTENILGNVLSSLDESTPSKVQDYDDKIDSISSQIIEVMRSGKSGEIRQQELNVLMKKQDELTTQKTKLLEQMASRDMAKYRVDRIQETMKTLALESTLNEELMKANIEKIVIKDNTAKFIFKCGVEFEKYIKQGK